MKMRMSIAVKDEGYILATDDDDNLYIKNSLIFVDRAALKTAVDLWISNEAEALETHGHISSWDVSQVTDFGGLFRNKYNFNSDISNWDVSSGQNFHRMFRNAVSFNQDISGWDLSSATKLQAMFRNADAFSQDISGWDVSNVISFRGLFRESKFNLDISSWDVSRGLTFRNMFRGNRYFNQDLSSWNLNLDANVRDMFRFATAMKKNQNVSILLINLIILVHIQLPLIQLRNLLKHQLQIFTCQYLIVRRVQKLY